MLFPSHLFSLTPYLRLYLWHSATHSLCHGFCIQVFCVTCCPFKLLSWSCIHSLALTQKHSLVTVVNSLWNSFYHKLSFLHSSVTVCVTHIIRNCHYHYPLQISQFRLNLSSVPDEALLSSQFWEMQKPKCSRLWDADVGERVGVCDLFEGDLHHGRQGTDMAILS